MTGSWQHRDDWFVATPMYKQTRSPHNAQNPSHVDDFRDDWFVATPVYTQTRTPHTEHNPPQVDDFRKTGSWQHPCTHKHAHHTLNKTPPQIDTFRDDCISSAAQNEQPFGDILNIHPQYSSRR